MVNDFRFINPRLHYFARGVTKIDGGQKSTWKNIGQDLRHGLAKLSVNMHEFWNYCFFSSSLTCMDLFM